MNGVIYLVANDKLIFTACRSFKCFIVGLFGGLLVLNFGNVFGTKFASLIKALATLVIIKLFLKLRGYVFYKSLFASSPIFYELDERHVPAANRFLNITSFLSTFSVSVDFVCRSSMESRILLVSSDNGLPSKTRYIELSI